MKELFLLRGLPGAGKSTLAKALGGEQVEADQYFIVDGEYRFDPTKIKTAHEWCRNQVSDWMFLEFERIVVSNTFTQEWEMEAYIKMAKEKGYRVYSLIVENRHGGENIHGVPVDKLEQMKNRFEFKL
jgi:predicted kinase